MRMKDSEISIKDFSAPFFLKLIMVRLFDMNENVKILLVGAGAVGSYYTGKLHQAGASVSAVVRSDYEAVLENGISVSSCTGDFHFKPEHIIKSAEEYPLRPDYIIVATKVLPHVSVPDLIKSAVFPETTIVLLQNGIEIENETAEAFPDNEIISCLAFICVSRTGPAIIDHQDYGRIVIGKYPEGISEKTVNLASLFSSSGVNCEIDENIVAARWKKLVWNAPFNPISVLSGGSTTREMLSDPGTHDLVEDVMKEVVRLAARSGCQLDEGVINKNLSDTFKMTPYKTSMLLDYENGREMEVEAILGNAVRIADSLDESIPNIRALYALLGLVNKKLVS